MSISRDLDEQIRDPDIEDEENEELVSEDNVEMVNKYDICPVGRFLSKKTINSRVMKNKLANVWRPAIRINIKDIGEGMFLFITRRRICSKFYTEVHRVLITL